MHETELGINGKAPALLALLFFVSQAEEVTSVADFFSGRNLPITECFEDMNASYELIKMGLNKHAFIALRVAVDNGLLAAYWKATGDRTKEFRRWLRSADPTPRKSRPFWEELRKVPALGAFYAKFPFQEEIAALDELSDYVHTRGASYATTTDFQNKVQSRNDYVHFDKWWEAFKASVRVVLILQLLVNPKLSIDIHDDFLLAKFGTYDKIPFMGILFGGHAEAIKEAIGDSEYEAIVQLASNTHEVKSILDYIQQMPDLSKNELRALILEEQKKHILDVGFSDWLSNRNVYDHRIDEDMISELQKWVSTIGEV
jgi:hypothetical protein